MVYKKVFSHEIPSNMRVGLNASIAFDVSIQQLQMLLYGSSLYIIPSEVRTNPERFVSYIRENKLEMFDMTPSLLQLLIDGGLLETSADVHVPSKILVGGEAIMPSLWKQLVETEKLIFITYTVLQNVRLMQRVIISKQIVRELQLDVRCRTFKLMY